MSEEKKERLSAHEVAVWLRRHPRFLAQYPDLTLSLSGSPPLTEKRSRPARRRQRIDHPRSSTRLVVTPVSSSGVRSMRLGR